MSKQEFLAELEARLSGLPQDSIEDRLTFYSEMIDDRMEEGLSEEEAVAGIGAVDDIVSQIVAETPLARIVKEKVTPKRALQAWEIVLLALGSPLWIAIAATAAVGILTVYGVLWVFIACLWVAEATFAVCSLAGIVSAVVSSGIIVRIAMLGAGAFFAGLTILWFFPCKRASQSILRLTKKMALVIKSVFIGKEDAK